MKEGWEGRAGVGVRFKLTLLMSASMLSTGVGVTACPASATFCTFTVVCTGEGGKRKVWEKVGKDLHLSPPFPFPNKRY